MKIIDAHAHVARYISGIGSQGELQGIGNGMAKYASGHEFRMIPEGMGDYGVTPEALLEVMDKHNVEKAVLLQGMYLGFQNLYTYDAVKKYPDRFVGAASYDPFCVNKEKIIHHLFDELNFKILKLELSNGSGLMAYHRELNIYEDLDDVFKMASEKNLVVVLDIGRPRNCCWQVDNLQKVFLKYPDTTFVVCHLLSPQINDYDLLKESLIKLNLDNVYFDLASVASNAKPEVYPYPTAQKHIKLAKEILGCKKLMFGSDMPSSLTRDSYYNLLNYMLNIFTKEEQKDVFYNNAKEIYFK